MSHPPPLRRYALALLVLAALPPAVARGRAARDRTVHPGDRVELLVGQPPPEPPAFPAAPGTGPDAEDGAGPDPEPDLAWEPGGLAYAARVPWAAPEARGDQWLAAANRSLFLVSGRGEVRPVPDPVPTGLDRRAPDFTRVAVRPLTGGDAAWEAFAWDARGRRIWRLDAKGRLAPYVALGDTIVYCYDLAVDRRGQVYISGARIVPDPGGDPRAAIEYDGLYRIGRDRSATLLAGGSSSGRVVDGTGARARFAHQVQFTLAEDRGCAYILDYDEDGAWVRTLRLADGAVTSRRLDHQRFQGPFIHSWAAYHRGVLLASVASPPAVFAVDPASGRCEPVYQEAPAPRPEPGIRTAAASRVPVEGPCWREGRPAVQGGFGSMGFNACGLGIGAGGRIAFVAANRLGLLRLDWSDPGSPLSRGPAPRVDRHK